MSKKIGVGIIGVEPERSWAAIAHIPALQALSDDFEIVAVANSRQTSADTAAAHYGFPRAFASAEALAQCPEVDLVAVTVKVPHHLELVRAAVSGGKHVLCEWPLGNGLAEAREIAALADKAGVIAICGTQAVFAPALIHAGELIRQGYVGDVLSVSVIGSGLVWGPYINTPNAYTLDVRNGAHMLAIPVGHTLAGMSRILGDITDVGAMLAHMRTSSLNTDTGEDVPMTAPDQVLFHARIDGKPLSFHFRGGTPRGTGLLIEINGTAGDLQITGPGGHTQLVELELSGATGDAPTLSPIAIPESCFGGTLPSGNPGNVARLYKQIARHLRTGSSDCPTFAEAVKHHQVIAAIEASAASGCTTQPDDF